MQGQESSKHQLLAFDFFLPLPKLTRVGCFAEHEQCTLSLLASLSISAPEKLSSSIWMSRIHFPFLSRKRKENK